METSAVIPLAKILFVFVAMLSGIKYRLGIGPSILAGSVLTGLLFGISPELWIAAAASSLLDLKLVLLALIVTLIMILSRIMENSGQSRRLMAELSGFLKWPRLKLVFFPALIGLLPMPGGAVFSAPMVKDAARGHDLSSKDKILVNYWFRHVWELIWPLYPGLILAAHFSGIPLVKLLGYTWPGLLVCLVLGWFFYLYPLKINPAEPGPSTALNPGKAFLLSLPLLIAIAGSLGLEALVWYLDTALAPEAGLVAGLFLAIIVCVRQNSFTFKQTAAFLKERRLWQMVFVVLSIFIFKGILDDGGIVREISGSIAGPSTLLAATVMLPMLVGLISGITIAFVGSTFPLILGIVDQLGIQVNTAYVVLGLFSGFAGVMVSPIHICFLLTCEFFHANVASVWPRLFAPCLILFIFGLGYFYLLS